MGLQRATDRRVIGRYELDHVAPTEQLLHQRLLAGRHLYGILSGLLKRVGAAVLCDGEKAFCGEIDDGSGKGLVIVTHASHEAHRRRRKTFGCGVLGHDDTGFGILAHLDPHEQVIREQQGHAGGNHREVTVIAKEMAQLVGECGFGDVTLRPHDDDGEPLLSS